MHGHAAPRREYERPRMAGAAGAAGISQLSSGVRLASLGWGLGFELPRPHIS